MWNILQTFALVLSEQKEWFDSHKIEIENIIREYKEDINSNMQTMQIDPLDQQMT